MGQRALRQKPPHMSKQQSSCVKVPWDKGHLRQKTFTRQNHEEYSFKIPVFASQKVQTLKITLFFSR